MASSYTTNYNLDKYVGTDKPNLRDQYNAAMDKIDNALLAANTNATEAKATTLSFQGDLDGLQEQIGSGFSSSSTVADAINAEKTARQNADTALSNSISSEQTARQNADSALSQDISDEETARQNADAFLSADITELKSILPASAFSSSNTVKKYIDDKTESKQKHLVIFGDSWADYNVQVNQGYLTQLARDLNATAHNYAVNGARFTGSSNLVSTQVTNFLNDASINKSQVTYIYMIGGVNDYHLHNVAIIDLELAIKAELDRLIQACPQAHILYAINFAYPYNQETMNDLQLIMGYLQTYFSITLINPYGLFSANLMNQSNWLHLTETGYKVLGQMVYSGFEGGQIVPNLKQSGTLTSQENNCTLKWHCLPIQNVGAVIDLHFVTTVASSGASNLVATFDLEPIASTIPWIYTMTDRLFATVGGGGKKVLFDLTSAKKLRYNVLAEGAAFASGIIGEFTISA